MSAHDTQHVSVCKQAAMLAQVGGTIEHIDDLESAYLILNGATSLQVNNQWMEVFQLNGATSDNWNTAANQFLIALGAPFMNLQDNWLWFWCVNSGAISAAVWLAAGSPFMFGVPANLPAGNSDADHLLAAQFKGVGSPSFVTDAGLMLPDHEGVYRPLLAANDSPWHGSRVAENLATNSNDFTLWATTASPDIVDNGDGSFTVTTTTAGNTDIFFSYNSAVDTESYIASILAKDITGSPTSAGLLVQIQGGGGGFLEESFLNLIPLTSAVFQRFKTAHTASNASTARAVIIIRLLRNGGTNASITIKKAMFENSTGRVASLTIPSDYIETGATSVEQKYSNLNGNTVTSGIVDDSVVGASLAVLPSLFAAPAGNYEGGNIVVTNAIQLPYDSGNHNDAEGAYFCWVNLQNTGLIIDGFLNTGGGNITLNDGTTSVTRPYSVNTLHRVGVAYNAGDSLMALNVDGTWSADVAYDATLLQGALDLLRGVNDKSNINNVQRYETGIYADDKAQIDTLMALP